MNGIPCSGLVWLGAGRIMFAEWMSFSLDYRVSGFILSESPMINYKYLSVLTS